MSSTTATLGPCLFCGGPAVRGPEPRNGNPDVGPRRFLYRRCLACGTVSLVDVPDDLGPFYPQAYYVLPSTAEFEQRYAKGEEDKLARVRSRVEPGRLVEIGPGTGAFAHFARRAGFDVTAIEMDRRVCEHLRTVVGVEVVEHDDPVAALAELPPARAITMWHVIEHLRDPAGALDAAAAALEPGGVLTVSAPNPRSLQFRLLRSRWLHLDPPRHLAVMPLDAIAGRLSGAGLRLVEATTSDPLGKSFNRGGWERGIARPRASGFGSRLLAFVATLVELGLRPIEGRGMRGAAYTAVFVKDGSA